MSNIEQQVDNFDKLLSTLDKQQRELLMESVSNITCVNKDMFINKIREYDDV